MGLDEYGYPVTAIANSILIKQNEYGDNAKELEDAWLSWLHYSPFDAPVATKLASLMREKLARIDSKKDAARRQLLQRKLTLATQRAERYDLSDFIQ